MFSSTFVSSYQACADGRFEKCKSCVWARCLLEVWKCVQPQAAVNLDCSSFWLGILLVSLHKKIKLIYLLDDERVVARFWGVRVHTPCCGDHETHHQQNIITVVSLHIVCYGLSCSLCWTRKHYIFLTGWRSERFHFFAALLSAQCVVVLVVWEWVSSLISSTRRALMTLAEIIQGMSWHGWRL